MSLTLTQAANEWAGYGWIPTYGFLALAVCSLWLNPKAAGHKIPLWIILLAVAFFFALALGYAGLTSVLYAAVYSMAVFQYYKTGRIPYFFAGIVLSMPLMLHLSFTGFNNYQYLERINISANSSAFSLYFNFDKTLIGLFIIGFGGDHLQLDMRPFFYRLFLSLLVMICAILPIALAMQYIAFEPKFPDFTIVWALVNLLFVCTAEEAFFRKLIQEKMYRLFSFKHSGLIAIALSSLIFGIAHFKGGPAYIALAAIAGLFYGHIFYKTGKIESAILLHFIFNLTHFLLFSYPSIRLK